MKTRRNQTIQLLLILLTITQASASASAATSASDSAVKHGTEIIATTTTTATPNTNPWSLSQRPAVDTCTHYISASTGNDANTGETRDKSLKTLKQLFTLLPSINNNITICMDTRNGNIYTEQISNFDTQPLLNVTMILMPDEFFSSNDIYFRSTTITITTWYNMYVYNAYFIGTQPSQHIFAYYSMLQNHQLLIYNCTFESTVSNNSLIKAQSGYITIMNSKFINSPGFIPFVLTSPFQISLISNEFSNSIFSGRSILDSPTVSLVDNKITGNLNALSNDAWFLIKNDINVYHSRIEMINNMIAHNQINDADTSMFSISMDEFLLNNNIFHVNTLEYTCIVLTNLKDVTITGNMIGCNTNVDEQYISILNDQHISINSTGAIQTPYQAFYDFNNQPSCITNVCASPSISPYRMFSCLSCPINYIPNEFGDECQTCPSGSHRNLNDVTCVSNSNSDDSNDSKRTTAIAIVIAFAVLFGIGLIVLLLNWYRKRNENRSRLHVNDSYQSV